MSESDSTLPVPAPAPDTPPKRRRLRRFLILAACVLFILIGTPVAFYFWASSPATQNFVRKRMVNWLEEASGGRVEIAAFHWHLLDLQADAEGVVLHGREAAGEAPCARIDHLTASFTILGLLSPRMLLRDLEISHPAVHLIVYEDGTTNLPTPRKPKKPAKSAINTLFDLEAGHVAVEQGQLDFENRAAEFDFQNRFTLLAFEADDVSVLMRYIPPAGADPETYRIEAGTTELSLYRGKEKPALGSMQATLDLTRNAATLRSLRLTSKFPTGKKRNEEEHTLEVSGLLQDFAHPRWQARITGELDLRLLEPTLGYNLDPQGIAHLDLDSAGEGGEFRFDGDVHSVDTAYIGTGVVVTGVRLDAHVHADPRQLLISKIVARLRQGGQLEGEVALTPWLPPIPQPRLSSARV